MRDLAKPVGVARYVTRLVETLPAAFKDALPAPSDIEAELSKSTNRGTGKSTWHHPGSLHHGRLQTRSRANHQLLIPARSNKENQSSPKPGSPVHFTGITSALSSDTAACSPNLLARICFPLDTAVLACIIPHDENLGLRNGRQAVSAFIGSMTWERGSNGKQMGGWLR